MYLLATIITSFFAVVTAKLPLPDLYVVQFTSRHSEIPSYRFETNYHEISSNWEIVGKEEEKALKAFSSPTDQFNMKMTVCRTNNAGFNSHIIHKNFSRKCREHFIFYVAERSYCENKHSPHEGLKYRTYFTGICRASDKSKYTRIVHSGQKTCYGNDSAMKTYAFCAFQPVECDSPKMPANAKPLFGPFYAHHEVTLSCEDGYLPVPEHSSITCQDDGTWTNKEMECKMVTCLHPNQHFQNGYAYGNNRVGNTMRFKCSEGYLLIGAHSITCKSDGTWNSHIPRCELVTCWHPEKHFHNGYAYGSNHAGNTMSFECNKGYRLIGAHSATCKSDGKWDSPIPICELVKCLHPDQHFHNGYAYGSNHAGHTMSFKCYKGYHLIGAHFTTCKSDGKWDSQIPRCEIVKCAPPPFIENGNIIGTDFTFNRSITVTCLQGYRLTGEKILTCVLKNEDVTWSQPMPTCTKIRCEPPRVLDNGSFEVYMGYEYKDIVSYKCDQGYTLVGTKIRTCMNEGWDGYMPFCQIVTCPDPGTPDNGWQEGETLTFGSALHYGCNTGFILLGAKTIICHENGRWSSRKPVCKAIQCPLLSNPDHGTLIADNFEYDSLVHFECNPGYELKGSNFTYCQKNGQWSHSVPICHECPIGFYREGSDDEICTPCPEHSTTPTSATQSHLLCLCEAGFYGPLGGPCTEIFCQVPKPPEHGKIEDCGSENNGRCFLSCDPGYQLEGDSVLICTHQGWSGKMPHCKRCPENYYLDTNVCMPCPLNTFTYPNLGTSIEACVCKPGYQGEPGQQCKDVDECKTDNGGCNQECQNTIGSYLCFCTIPGYALQGDGKTCEQRFSCPNLEEGPKYGNTSCRSSEQQNGAVCHFQCSPGYFFVSGINDYVTCGRETKWKWSHRIINESARLPACTREYFVDMKISLNLTFLSNFPGGSASIDTNHFQQVIEDIISGLTECIDTCLVQNISSIYRDTEEGEQSVHNVFFDFMVLNPRSEVDANCTPSCIHENLRHLMKTAFTAFEALKIMAESHDRDLILIVEDIELVPISLSLLRRKPDFICPPGHVYTRKRLCSPCDAGFFLKNQGEETCLSCPKGTYQQEQGQTYCIPCPEGATTLTEGSDHPVMCNIRDDELLVYPKPA